MLQLGIMTALVLALLQIMHAFGKVDPLHKRVFGETPAAEPTWFCITKLRAGKKWQTFHTPGYPKKLQMKQSRCTWKIATPGKSKIRIAFRGIGLAAEDPEHCASNYLEIIDETLGKSQGRFCGRKTNGDIVSKGNKLRIDLQIDLSEEYQRGFSVSYMATKAKSGFYGKKTFNDKPLPPLKPRKQKAEDSKSETPAKKEKPKSDSKSKGDMVPMLTADGQLIMVQKGSNPSKRQITSYDNDRRDFKKLSGSSGGSAGGMSTLVIVGIVVGGAVGVLIIVLILRKIIMNKREKKESDGAVGTNSGLPKMHMNHENVVNLKRNILSPAVIVENKSDPPEPHKQSWKGSQTSSSEAEKTSNSPPEYNDIYKDEHHGPRSQSMRLKYDSNADKGRGGSKINGYANDSPRLVSQYNNEQRKRERGDAGRRGGNGIPGVAARKMPYRYNSRRNQDFDDTEAIEALNNEKFCNNEMYEMSPPAKQRSISRIVIPTRESRVFSQVDDEDTNQLKSQRSSRKNNRSLPLKYGDHPKEMELDHDDEFDCSKTHKAIRRDRVRVHSSKIDSRRIPYQLEKSGQRNDEKRTQREGRCKRPSDKQQWNIKREQNEVDAKGKSSGVALERMHSMNKSGHLKTYDCEIPTIRMDHNVKKRNSCGRQGRFDPRPSPPNLPRHVVLSSRPH